MRLAVLEEQEGHYAKAIEWLRMAIEKKASPHPEALQAHILELQSKEKLKSE